MTDPPAWIDDLAQDLRELGEQRKDDGAIGWSLEQDYLYRIDDDQPQTIGARTGDIYRSSDPSVSFEYTGTSFYLDLDGDPLEQADRDYGLWFDIIRGKPHVHIDTDLELWDVDPVYHAVEEILAEYEYGVIHDGEPDPIR